MKHYGFFSHDTRGWMAVCACGWTSKWLKFELAADRAMDRHKKKVAPEEKMKP